MENVQLLLIDPQNDFMDIPNATLSVPGANEDMKRVAALIDRLGDVLSDIHVTMDSHHPVDISHPAMWRKADGSPMDPFTEISLQDFDSGVSVLRDKRADARVRAYIQALENAKRYKLMVWPEHCLIGTWGHNIQSDVQEALNRWARRNLATVNYVTKGSNPWTEHYSGVQAEVPDPKDLSTSLNRGLLTLLESADVILVAGEALSHCVANTVRDVAANFGKDSISKIVLLTDCCSSVISPYVDFPAISAEFIKDLTSMGMRTAVSTDFMSAIGKK